MNLRWKVSEFEIQLWNERWQEYETRVLKSDPCLEYETEFGWKPLPTIVERIKDE